MRGHWTTVFYKVRLVIDSTEETQDPVRTQRETSGNVLCSRSSGNDSRVCRRTCRYWTFRNHHHANVSHPNYLSTYYLLQSIQGSSTNSSYVKPLQLAFYTLSSMNMNYSPLAILHAYHLLWISHSRHDGWMKRVLVSHAHRFALLPLSPACRWFSAHRLSIYCTISRDACSLVLYLI